MIINEPHPRCWHVIKAARYRAIAGGKMLSGPIKDHVVAGVGEIRHVHGGDQLLAHTPAIHGLPIGTDVPLFGEVFNLPAVGFAALLVEWLFGVHTCASVSFVSVSH